MHQFRVTHHPLSASRTDFNKMISDFLATHEKPRLNNYEHHHFSSHSSLITSHNQKRLSKPIFKTHYSPEKEPVKIGRDLYSENTTRKNLTPGPGAYDSIIYKNKSTLLGHITR